MRRFGNSHIRRMKSRAPQKAIDYDRLICGRYPPCGIHIFICLRRLEVSATRQRPKASQTPAAKPDERAHRGTML